MRNDEENRSGASTPENELSESEMSSDDETVILEPDWEKETAPDPRPRLNNLPPLRRQFATGMLLAPRDDKQNDEKQEKEFDELPRRSEFRPF